MNMLGDLNEKYDGLCEKMDALTAALHEFPRSDQTHSRQEREWQPFKLNDGGQVASNGTTFTVGGGQSALLPAARGWEAYVERIVLTADGSSSGAFAAVFRGPAGVLDLVDRAATFAAVNILGITTYTNVADYNSPIYFLDGQHVTIEFGGCANSANVNVIVYGRRREM